MTQINSVNGTNSMNLDGIDLKGMSPFAAAALVQLEIAKTNKDSATRYISEMKAQNDQARKYLEQADALKAINTNPAYAKYKLPENLEEMKKTLADVEYVQATYEKMESQIADGTLKPDKNGLYTMDKTSDDKLHDFVNKAGHDNFPNIVRTADGSFDNLHFKYELDDGLKEIKQYKEFLTSMIKATENGTIPQDMLGKNKTLNTATIDSIISSLQHQAENCNSDNQTQMVKLQDKMGQYNAFVSGSSDMIKTGAQLQQSILRN
ncbi:hypothetical protein SAMN02910357_01252 [Succinivibrio dextrinosolvens]|uniref:hypothetical protein n=1 Tax=Succinivibrio dextrinosolvens TaxID=83771 RepID=UPI0008E3DF9F|nr:hypothetical protein [Succinivibrio dextrinosolvens]SFS58556.1 hypothetical protein SAMN02910357_01252 [Succinivibrio dextrinosolvens]